MCARCAKLQGMELECERAVSCSRCPSLRTKVEVGVRAAWRFSVAGEAEIITRVLAVRDTSPTALQSPPATEPPPSASDPDSSPCAYPHATRTFAPSTDNVPNRTAPLHKETDTAPFMNYPS